MEEKAQCQAEISFTNFLSGNIGNAKLGKKKQTHIQMSETELVL
jgi:hypothetical protein